MAFESMIGDLMKEDSIDANKILHELLDPKNIDMKTDIADPITFATLEALLLVLEDMLFTMKHTKTYLPISQKVLKTFIVQLKKLLVSWNRKGRIEITDTLKANREQDSSTRSLFQRLTGMNK